ncbi:uncharacterized protein LOC142979733 [Anticarsia gemmatalis]|uniref:uncharacterized protein LOC142979733 n=1 Tax=Anticarsia gemmatalis TaxID=129554 RepID=UPI003F76CB72
MKVILGAICLLASMNTFEASKQVVVLVQKDESSANSVARRRNTHDVKPGHSLIRPSKTMLKSAAKFPKEKKHLVYGDLGNLGITYGKTPFRFVYSGFRKHNDDDEDKAGQVLKLISKWMKKLMKQKPSGRETEREKNLINRKKRIPTKLEKIKSLIRKLNKKPSKTDNFRIPFSIGIKPENIKKRSQKEPQIQYLLDKQGQVEFKITPRGNTLNERTKSIQDFLNSQIRIEKNNLALDRKTIEIQNYLNNRDKGTLSLNEKTRHIQNLLNNEAQAPNNQDTLYNNIQDGKVSLNVKNKAPMWHNQINERENTANEIQDRYSSEDSSDEEDDGFWHPNGRRTTSNRKMKYRDRDRIWSKSTSKSSDSESKDSDDSDASSEYEKNPGNPFTIHKNKYKVNWMWNHFMDGDHMNINPYGPSFGSLGPSGADLFFGRKWWYFNQDDYKPMG